MLEYLYGKRFDSKITIFEPKLFPCKYFNIFKPSHFYIAYEDGTDRVFRNVGI